VQAWLFYCTHKYYFNAIWKLSIYAVFAPAVNAGPGTLFEITVMPFLFDAETKIVCECPEKIKFLSERFLRGGRARMMRDHLE
jgi:hypothetical protein